MVGVNRILILAGCFFNFTGNIKVLDVLSNILPQKAFMILSQAIENGRPFHEFIGQLIYIVAWVITLWLVGSLVTKRKIKRSVY